MKAYLTALCVSLIITFVVTLMISFVHMWVYEYQEAFESFYGVEVKKFNYIYYGSLWIVSALLVALAIKSDFEDNAEVEAVE